MCQRKPGKVKGGRCQGKPYKPQKKQAPENCKPQKDCNTEYIVSVYKPQKDCNTEYIVLHPGNPRVPARILVKAKRNINRDEELFVNYGA